MKNLLPPGLRELMNGSVQLSPEELAGLTGDAVLICIPVDLDAAGPNFWRDRGLPRNERSQCERCKCAILVRPWAMIATHKVCSRCIGPEEVNKAMTPWTPTSTQ